MYNGQWIIDNSSFFILHSSFFIAPASSASATSIITASRSAVIIRELTEGQLLCTPFLQNLKNLRVSAHLR